MEASTEGRMVRGKMMKNLEKKRKEGGEEKKTRRKEETNDERIQGRKDGRLMEVR